MREIVKLKMLNRVLSVCKKKKNDRKKKKNKSRQAVFEDNPGGTGWYFEL